ncbi:MAG TPA: hypothetical protein DCS43_11700 [Verrucomicrobia bacterium]|nr:hypothetical protein [Verrucomicrobiota bacterium]
MYESACMTDDDEAFLNCLRDAPDGGWDGHLSRLLPSDWDRILQMARLHALAPWLYEKLRDQPLLPVSVRDTLQRAYYYSTARNLRIQAQWRELLALFDRHGIRVVTLKGCDLAWFVYPEPGLRPMTDIDLLLEEKDIASAGVLLVANGYRADTGASGASGKHTMPYLKHGGVPVELHYHLAEPPYAERINLAELRARTREVDGCTVRCLGPEDRLLYLALHTCLAHGLDAGLLPFIDMQRILHVDGQRLDTRALVERARQWGVERALSVMLGLMQRFLDGVPPVLPLPPVAPAMLEASVPFVLERPCRLPEGFMKALTAGSGARTWQIIQSRLFESHGQGGGRPVAGTVQRLAGLLRKYSRSIAGGVFRHRELRQRIRREQQRRALIDWIARG